MVALPFTFIECVCRKVKKLSEIARDFLLCQNLRVSSFKKPTKIWRNLEGKLEGSNDWPDAAFSIVFLWFLDLEALLWIRRKGDQTSYDSSPIWSSMLHGRPNAFLNGLCAHVASAITGPLGRIVTTSEIPSCGTSTCKIHHGVASLIWMQQCCSAPAATKTHAVPPNSILALCREIL